MTNDYSPATPPWLQTTPLPEPPNGRSHDEDRRRDANASTPEQNRDQPSRSQQRTDERSEAQSRPSNAGGGRQVDAPESTGARPEPRTAEPPLPWQRGNFGPAPTPGPTPPAQHQLAPQHLQQQPAVPQPPVPQPPVQQQPIQPPVHQLPVQQHAQPQSHQQPAQQQPTQPRHEAQPHSGYQHHVSPENGPREKSEIGTDGTVRRVPFHEDRVAQMYQAPPDIPASSPVYTWTPPPAQQPGGWQQTQQNPPAQSVNDLSLLRRAKRPPRSGWRLAVHRASGGSINPGESTADVAYRELVDRVNQPVRGDYRIAILSLKGGVGKTTTTIGLGSTFASLRGDRVIAIDANPDLGTLAHRVPKQTNSTVRTLLDDGAIHRYSDVRAHTSQAPSRLEVLASEQDPAVSEAFSEADYRSAIEILQAYYNIILTDCGTGLMHSAMTGVLDMASALVLVTSPAIDGARSASATLDWLEHHGYGKLVERTVVVVNSSRKGASSVDIDQLRKLFLDRTRAVAVVPFDDHLAEGAEIDLDLVSKPTRRALLELAATVADEFQR